jgi:hypothetical protein
MQLRNSTWLSRAHRMRGPVPCAGGCGQAKRRGRRVPRDAAEGLWFGSAVDGCAGKRMTTAAGRSDG